MNKFKVGDEVKVVKTGRCGWEQTDWARIAFNQARITYPAGQAVIIDVDDTSVQIKGSNFKIDPGHFEKVYELTCTTGTINVDNRTYKDINSWYTLTESTPMQSKWFLDYNQLTKPTGIKKYMTNIVEFAKNLTLSADEKVLREVGLKNSEGNWTYEAISIIKNLEAKELGFDDYVKMAKSIFRGYSTAGIESGSIAFSAFELAKTFKKHEPRLLEIAREMKANEDKAKI